LIPAMDASLCAYCSGPLCVTCWEKFGNCGHPGEDEKLRAARERVAAIEWLETLRANHGGRVRPNK
jgi:hypothetical protein